MIRSVELTEYHYTISSSGPYGAHTILDLTLTNKGFLPALYTLTVEFYDGDELVDTVSKRDMLMPRTSKHYTVETYNMTTSAVLILGRFLTGFPVKKITLQPS